MKRHIRIKTNSIYYNKPTTSSVGKHIIILDYEPKNQPSNTSINARAYIRIFFCIFAIINSVILFSVNSIFQFQAALKVGNCNAFSLLLLPHPQRQRGERFSLKQISFLYSLKVFRTPTDRKQISVIVFANLKLR